MKFNGLGFYAGVVVVAVALDQWIKYMVETGMDMHVRVPVLPFLALFRTHNTGIAFSMFSDLGSVGLIAITLAVVGFVLWIAVRTDHGQRYARFGFALIIGGAIGNLIDRVWHGYVVDYVLFHLPNWSFAVFNLADAFISVGAALVVLEEFLIWRRSRKDGSPG
ncbi:signal peptidase II [Neoaquamicrobium microcysteis]|uniref:signal peptidase II n=1 Tax=Neoaquamicrobium microcysteis TaxID=2682781 RepID=UPI00191BF359|nr:signal peptidase II [Mesorhizobium microcysteis]